MWFELTENIFFGVDRWIEWRSIGLLVRGYIYRWKYITSACFIFNMEYISDMKLLENMQRRWIKRINGFKNLTKFQRLKDMNFFSIDGRLLIPDVIKYWRKFHSICGICPEYTFVLDKGWQKVDKKTNLEVPRSARRRLLLSYLFQTHPNLEVLRSTGGRVLLGHLI